MNFCVRTRIDGNCGESGLRKNQQKVKYTAGPAWPSAFVVNENYRRTRMSFLKPFRTEHKLVRFTTFLKLTKFLY